MANRFKGNTPPIAVFIQEDGVMEHFDPVTRYRGVVLPTYDCEVFPFTDIGFVEGVDTGKLLAFVRIAVPNVENTNMTAFVWGTEKVEHGGAAPGSIEFVQACDEAVSEALRYSVTHEVDEYLRRDGDFVHDPHVVGRVLAPYAAASGDEDYRFARALRRP
jgi:hypothetical protein